MRRKQALPIDGELFADDPTDTGDEGADDRSYDNVRELGA